MKNVIISMLLSLFSLTTPLAVFADQASEENRVLKAIDDLCGDLWCEGPFSYRFLRLDIKPEDQRAELFFEMSSDQSQSFALDNETPLRANILKQVYLVSCQISGVSSAEAMLGGRHILRWDVYTNLNDCILSLEGRFKRLVRPQL